MGHQSNVKLLRRQVRNVAQETLPSVLTTEAVQALEKRVMEVVGTRLDEIGANVEKQLKVTDQQNNTFRGLLMRDASLQISRELTNIAITNMAWQEILVGKLQLENADSFAAEVEAKKQELFVRLEAEAKAKEAEELKAAEEAKARAEAAATEASVIESLATEETASND